MTGIYHKSKQHISVSTHMNNTQSAPQNVHQKHCKSISKCHWCALLLPVFPAGVIDGMVVLVTRVICGRWPRGRGVLTWREAFEAPTTTPELRRSKCIDYIHTCTVHSSDKCTEVCMSTMSTIPPISTTGTTHMYLKPITQIIYNQTMGLTAQSRAYNRVHMEHGGKSNSAATWKPMTGASCHRNQGN